MNRLCWIASAVLLMCAIYAANVKAETAIHLGGYSYHVATGHKEDYQDWHELVAVEHGNWIAGRFVNSYDRTSAIVGYGWSKQWGNWRGSVYVGAVYGYRSCYGDEGEKARVCPMAFPALHYAKYRAQPGVLVFGEAVAATVRVALY